MQILDLYRRLSDFVIDTNSWSRKYKTPTAIEAEAAERWILENGYALGPYLASCFSKHSWAYRPQLSRLSRSEYERHYKNNSTEAHLWWNNIKREDQIERPQSSVSRGREIVKAMLLAKGAEYCALSVESGFYNPDSSHCTQCVIKDRCGAI